MLKLLEYSDLAEVSATTRLSWDNEAVIRAKYLEYYDGTVLESETTVKTEIGETKVKDYPVGINLCKMLCLTQADSLFGEWEDAIISFEPAHEGEVSTATKAASDLARQILLSSNADSMLWEVALDREIYGGGAIKIMPSLNVPGFIKWTRIPLDGFYPVWDPEDEWRLLEAYIVTEINKEQSVAKYGMTPVEGDTALLVEHWTLKRYETKLDGRIISKYTGINPWGFVPIVFIPRMRSRHWWGDSLIEDLTDIQDSLNSRVADLGDSISYNTHPIKYGMNITKGFSAKNFPVGPNVMWDLGRVISDTQKPEVGILEANNPIPNGSFEYIKFLYDWSRVSVFAPPIVFGEDDGGGQRSGITLEIRMLPLVRALRRSRSYMATGLRQAMKLSAMILRQKEISTVSTHALERLIRGDVRPHFAPVLPRDQAAIIDEVTKAMAARIPLISVETSVKKLGYGTAEVERIEAMIDEYEIELNKSNELPPGSNSASGAEPKS